MGLIRSVNIKRQNGSTNTTALIFLSRQRTGKNGFTGMGSGAGCGVRGVNNGMLIDPNCSGGWFYTLLWFVLLPTLPLIVLIPDCFFEWLIIKWYFIWH